MDLVERFAKHVNKKGPKDPRMESRCWIWTASSGDGRYGQFWMGKGKTRQAHRIAWEIAHGPIPDGLVVCHRCDNTRCVRPSHLFLGTEQENTMDAYAKGRRGYLPPLRGHEHPRAKLTTDDVLAIRRRVAAGERQKDLAVEYGVAPNTISGIHHRKFWAHI